MSMGSSFFQVLPSIDHTACLGGSGQLHSTAVSTLGDFFTVLAYLICWGFQRLYFHQWSSGLFRDCKPATWWCQTLASLLTPWILGFPMILRLDCHLWSLFFSHSSQKSHSFSPRPLQFFKTSATWKTLTCSWDLRPGFDGTLGPSRPVLLHAHPGEILLEDFISLTTPLSLISATFSDLIDLN